MQLRMLLLVSSLLRIEHSVLLLLDLWKLKGQVIDASIFRGFVFVKPESQFGDLFVLVSAQLSMDLERTLGVLAGPDVDCSSMRGRFDVASFGEP